MEQNVDTKNVPLKRAYWVGCEDSKQLIDFKRHQNKNMANRLNMEMMSTSVILISLSRC